MIETDVISLLADGEFHSGTALAQILGVSRTAVWKYLQRLAEQGVVIESVKGRGYRIPGGIDLLDSNHIRARIVPELQGVISQIEVHRSVDSTNAYISALAERGHGVVCLAEQQTGGKGRRGRAWISPFGRNIYLSVGWSFEGGAASLEGLSLAVGVALCRAISARCGDQEALGLKWPNDVLYQGRKLAGILLEMTGDPNGLCHVVIGIGINQGMAPSHGEAIDQPWADISEFSRVARSDLAAELVNQLIPILASYPTSGFHCYLDEWRQYDLCRDKEVVLTTPARNIMGRAMGVSKGGAILIEGEDGVVKEYSGGEISLRITW